MKSIAVLQSNYIPWKGYFDMMHAVEEFVLYDDAQYTKQDWRNRNKIKTSQGASWLTVPVQRETAYFRPIHNVLVQTGPWLDSHLKAIRQNYSKAAYFAEVWEHVAGVYDRCRQETSLSRLNYTLLDAFRRLLGIETSLSWSMDYHLESTDPSLRLVELCQKANADIYLTGPAASNYLDLELFAAAGIRVEWMRYDNYPPYAQLYPPFTHHVSIIDVLFNTGIDKAPHYALPFSIGR